MPTGITSNSTVTAGTAYCYAATCVTTPIDAQWILVHSVLQ